MMNNTMGSWHRRDYVSFQTRKPAMTMVRYRNGEDGNDGFGEHRNQRQQKSKYPDIFGELVYDPLSVKWVYRELTHKAMAEQQDQLRATFNKTQTIFPNIDNQQRLTGPRLQNKS